MVKPPLLSQRLAFLAVLLFCLTLPSNWTQDVPARYGSRHPGLKHSWLYPQIDTAPPGSKDTGRVRPGGAQGILQKERETPAATGQ